MKSTIDQLIINSPYDGPRQYWSYDRETRLFSLSDLIHKFHQGPSREIWKIYTTSDPDTAVSRAVALGLLKKEEIPEDLLDILGLKIGFFTDLD